MQRPSWPQPISYVPASVLNPEGPSKHGFAPIGERDPIKNQNWNWVQANETSTKSTRLEEM